MRRYEASELFGLEQNKIAIWAKTSNPKLHKLADILTILSVDKAKEILKREEVRNEEDVKTLFGLREKTLKTYPKLTALLKRLYVDEIMMLCLIDSKHCFLDDLYPKQVQELFNEIQQNDTVEKDINELKKIFNVADKKTYKNNLLFIKKHIEPFISFIETLLEVKINIEYIYAADKGSKIEKICFKKNK